MRHFRPILLTPLLGLALLLPASPTSAAHPSRVWIAWLDGREIEQVLATKAVLLDRFPDAVLVADAASARVLADAGLRLEAPLELEPGATVTLLHAKRGGEAFDAAVFAASGARLAWASGADGIAFSDGPLPEDDALLRHERKVMRSAPLAARNPAPLAAKPQDRTQATDFAPVVQQMVDQVSGADVIQWIGNLAGSRAVTVGSTPVTFHTRSTPTTSCDLAEQYVFERLQSMGYTDVQYDPYTYSSTSARNVVATLPGVERPGHVVILGAHLDSTSPQASTLAPGANDNASGVAGLLVAAQILRQYSYRNTIRLIAFTGEEQGLYGSEHYANAAYARGDTIDGVVIFDMMAWHGSQFQIDIEGETAWLPIMNVMDDACAQYTTLATQIQLASWGSDHVPFQDVGYPAFLAIESEYDSYPCYHQTCDTTGWNQAALGGEVVKAALATVAHLAGPMDFYISHTPLPTTENTTGPYEVVATISQLAPLVPGSLWLHWSAGSGQNQAALTPTGVAGQYHAFIPGQPATSHVTYWLEAADTEGRHTAHPTNAPASSNSFFVGTRTTLLAEGFEGAPTGWTHGGTLDDWQFAAPAALGGDPATAAVGTRVAGTDLTGVGATSGHYENNCETWLESPALDCSNMAGVRLSFRRWLGVERSNSGTYDYARVLVNGQTVWESPSDANLVETAWSTQAIDASAYADGNAAVRLRFTMHSDGSVNFCGWNIDDVQVTGMSTVVTADVAAGAAPLAPALHPNTPNPGGPGTTLRFELPARAPVELSIYDVRGRLVRSLARGTWGAGEHRVTWDGRAEAGERCAPGVYFSRLVTSGVSLSRRLVLIR